MTLGVNGTSISVTAGAARAMTFPGSASVGQLAVVAITVNGGADPTSVTDNAAGGGSANTWVKLMNIAGHSNTVDMTVWACKLTRALTSSTTVTATYAASKAGHAAVLAAFDDVVSSVALDGTAATAAVSSGSVAVGPSGDPAASRVLSLFAVGARGNPTTITSVSPFNLIGAIRSTSGIGTSARFTALSYQYVDSPGPISASGTITSDTWVATVGSVAVPGGSDPTFVLGSIAI